MSLWVKDKFQYKVFKYTKNELIFDVSIYIDRVLHTFIYIVLWTTFVLTVL